jgi:hypothetical protein
MKWIKQTLTGELYGNCLQACFASVLEIRLDHVPNFMLFETHWWSALVMWLGTISYVIEYIECAPPSNGQYYITSLVYDCHAKGISHAVVMKDGIIVHNPWINNATKDLKYSIHGYYEICQTTKINLKTV